MPPKIKPFTLGTTGSLKAFAGFVELKLVARCKRRANVDSHRDWRKMRNIQQPQKVTLLLV